MPNLNYIIILCKVQHILLMLSCKNVISEHHQRLYISVGCFLLVQRLFDLHYQYKIVNTIAFSNDIDMQVVYIYMLFK